MYQFANDLYVEESRVRFYGVRIQTRMAVIRLSGDRLLLYSPVWLTPELRSELAGLGDVAYILSPNKIHNQTLRDYADAYPEAEVHVPPGLRERCPELRVSATLGDESPAAWREQLDQALTSGNVFFSEAVLLHRSSRTLLVGDLVENFDTSTASAFGRGAARVFGVGREPVASPEFRLYTHDAEAAERSFARILSWNFDRIFLCHGSLIREAGKDVLQRVTDGILRSSRERSRASRWVLRTLSGLQ